MRSRSPHSARARNDLPAMVEHSTFTDMPDGSVRETKRMKRNSERGGIIHTYTNPPNGPVGSKSTASSLTTPSGWLSTATYFTGGNSGLVFNYAGGISIEFVHVGTTNTNNEPSVPGKRPAGQLVRIGYIGGAGGGSDINRWHSHIVFFSNKARNERIDPRSIFCGF